MEVNSERASEPQTTMAHSPSPTTPHPTAQSRPHPRTRSRPRARPPPPAQTAAPSPSSSSSCLSLPPLSYVPAHQPPPPPPPLPPPPPPARPSPASTIPPAPSCAPPAPTRGGLSRDSASGTRPVRDHPAGTHRRTALHPRLSYQQRRETAPAVRSPSPRRASLHPCRNRSYASTTTLFRSVFVLLVCAFASLHNAPVTAQPAFCNESAIYNLTFAFNWTSQTDPFFPVLDPNNITNATSNTAPATITDDSNNSNNSNNNSITVNKPGFTQVLCVSHTPDYRLWELNRPVNETLHIYFRTAQGGGKALNETALDSVVLDMRSDINGSSIEDRHLLELAVSTKTFYEGNGTTAIQIPIQPNFTLLTCFTRVWPSDDWFTGINNTQLCEDGELVSNKTSELIPYDAGIFDSNNYTTAPGSTPRRNQTVVTKVANRTKTFGSVNITRAAPTPPPCLEVSMRYTLEFNFSWTPDDPSFPNGIAKVNPGFLQLLCAAHNQNYTLWEVSENMSEDLKSVFLNGQGEKKALAKEALTPVMQKLNQSLEESKAKRGLLMFNYSEQTFFEPESTVSLTLDVEAERNFTMISCFARVWPSTDWFTGIRPRYLCPDREKFENVLGIRLLPYDAGIFPSDSYTATPASPEDDDPDQLLIRRETRVTRNGYGSVNILRSDYERPQAETPNEKKPDCFPADEQVLHATGASVRMDSLQIGQHLRAWRDDADSDSGGNDDGGKIFAFSHRDANARSVFLRLLYRRPDGSTGAIRLSPGHFILTHNGNSAMLGEKFPGGVTERASSTIVEGDLLVCADGSACVVTAVQRVWAVGLYNPHPTCGRLVVSGVWTSAYTTAVSAPTANALLCAPRALATLGFPALLQPVIDGATHFGRWFLTSRRSF